MCTTNQNSNATYQAFEKWEDGDEEALTMIAHPDNPLGLNCETCRVFFSYTDLHLFAAERPFATIPDMIFIVNRIENLSKLRDELPKYEKIFSYQCCIFRRQRFVWAHLYTQKNLDNFFKDFIHDREHLIAWCGGAVVPGK